MIYSNKEIKSLKLTFKEIQLPVYTFNTLIVGSGAAGLNAADSLFNMGQKDIAIITEGMKTGVSKNAGENRQIYYKTAMASLSKSQDSVYDMADELYNGGSMDGDIALSESAMSLRCFYKLADIGVDFPQNSYGEFLDYSDGENKNIKCVADAGMFTAKKITEQLEKRILNNDIPIFNRFRVISVIKDTDEKGNEFAAGLLAIDKDMQAEYKSQIPDYIRNARRLEANKNIFEKIQKRISGETKNTSLIHIRENTKAEKPDEYIEEPEGNIYGYTLFRAINIIYAAGSPGGIYCDTSSAYPSDVTSSFSPAFAAGVYGKNLTETKYGITCIMANMSGQSDLDDREIINIFKWKMSDVFQKALPRYFSTDKDGTDEREFLDDYFNSAFDMFNAIIEKGQNWHFDTRELHANGSSVIDFAIYIEKSKGRKVYLDYFSNHSQFNSENLNKLKKGGGNSVLSLFSEQEIKYKPYERLIKLNFDAYKLFYDNGIDLRKTPVEINICAEHLNGGLSRDIHSESNIRRFFPVGESAATFGVYAPRGSSLNSTQVTSFRAAQKIARESNAVQPPISLTDFWVIASDEVHKYLITAEQLLQNAVKNAVSENVFEMREKYRARFSECAMIARPLNEIVNAIENCVMDMANFINDNSIDDAAYLSDVFINHDILVTQYTFLNAIKSYITSGGKSRGSYIIAENMEDIVKTYEETKNFDAVLNLKFKSSRRQNTENGVAHQEIDYNKFTSYIKIKSFMTYGIEYFTEEVRKIP